MAATTDWGSHILGIYQGFVLRDVLGYLFPGAVLILGLLQLLDLETASFDPVLSAFPRRPIWADVAFWVSASYTTGVFIRVFGVLIRLLVTFPQRGWFGDPRCVRPDGASLVFIESFWKSPDEQGLSDLLEERMGRDLMAYDRFVSREEVFLHLTGNLGCALVFLGALTLIRTPAVAGGLIVSGLILIMGHYRHARTARLGTRLRKKVATEPTGAASGAPAES